MFEKNDSSYSEYKKILQLIKDTGKYMDYSEAINSTEFIVLRHDIEFSIERAYNLSKIEKEQNITSSYFVQITNNFYNTFSEQNIDMLKEMIEDGHYIGLHYHRSNSLDICDVKEDIIFQSDILSKFLDYKIDRFSFHRPLKEYLKMNLKIRDMINTYSKEFFCYTENFTDDIDVKYIADSNHQWKYGTPSQKCFEKYKKIQVLIHPLSWTEEGSNHEQCFKEIMNEKRQELIQTIENEWKYYDLLKGRI